MTFSMKQIKSDFPIFKRTIRGKRLIYLDSAATSQKPQSVINALSDYYSNYNANIHRGLYLIAQEATMAYETARGRMRLFINAPASENIIFTRNTTESINLVAYAWARNNITDGDEILLSELEHHSNIIPWQQLAQEKNITLKYIPITGLDGRLDLSTLDTLLTEKTKLVALVHMSNALGTINPLQKIIQKAQAVGAVTLIDGAQSAPHMQVDVSELDCDFFVFSMHKMLGPTGVGVLYAKTERLNEAEPFLTGGEMIDQVYKDHATWNTLPWRFEAGTPNIADVIACTAALDYLNALGMDTVHQHEQKITAYALDKLSAMPGITLIGPQIMQQRGGVISFEMDGIHTHDIAQFLDSRGICIRVGNHCAQPLMQCLERAGTARLSIYIYNDETDIDELIDSLNDCRKYFG